MYHAARSELKRLWPLAVLATTATVILPVVAILALTWLGFALPHILASVLGTLAIAIGVASLGASIWNRRKESVDVPFGELMLWRYLRRRRAQRRADENVAEVDLGPDRATKRVIKLEQDGSLEVLHRLTLALEATDPYTMGHSRRVERHVHRTAMAMGLSTHEIRELRLAAALHDVGKICVPHRILRKDGALTPAEMAIVREHVSVGAMMVAGAAPESVTEAILRHHEFWDGHGYPSGIAGENIPMFARVIAIADVWDAITSARPYKGGEARSRAMDVLSDRAGSQFDPDLVDVFLKGLPAALPVTSALLIFLTQHRSTRPVYEWTHTSAFADVSRAAATAGTAAAVVAVGAIGPQILTAPGSERAEAAGRSAISLIDLIGEGNDRAPMFEASAWAPGFRTGATSRVADAAQNVYVGSQETALVPPTNHVVLPDTDDVPETSPFDVPNVEPPASGGPPVVVEPPVDTVPVDPPAPATPPVDVFVPPVIVPLPPVDVPPQGEFPPIGEPPPLHEMPPSAEAPIEEGEPKPPQAFDPSHPDGAPGHDPEGPGNSEEAPGHEKNVEITDPVAETEPIIEDAPGNSENAPGQDPAGPGNSENAPGQDPAGPGNSENAPGQVDDVEITDPVAETELIVEDGPGNSEEAPGHDPEGPGNSEDAPGHDPEGPGNSEEAPGHDPEGPGNSEDAPGQADDVEITDPVAETEPIVEHGPGNSENAPGHAPGGPGNSENAPGHGTVPLPDDLEGSEWLSEGEVWLEEAAPPAT